MGGVQNLTRADNKEGSRVKIEVTRVNYGRDSLPFIQGKLLADEEGEMVEYDSGIEVKIEVTRVNYGRDSLPFIQGKLLADEEREMVGYDSGIEVKSEAGTPIPPVTEKRKRDEEEEE